MSTFTNRQRNLAIGGSALVGLAIAATLGAGYIATSGTIPGAWFITGEQAYSTTDTSSDIALTSTTSVFAYTGSSTATFTGFAGGVAGRTVIGENRTAFNVTLSYEVTSTAANRLSTPTSVDWTCLPGGSWTQMYVAGSTNRWLVFPGSACFSSTHPMLGSAAVVGEWAQWDGTQWQSRVLNDYRSKHLEWNDEYMYSSALANNTAAGSLMSIFISGTGAAVFPNSGTTTRPGLLRFESGTTTTGQAGMFASTGSIDFGSYSSTTFEWVGGVQTLSTVAEEYAVAIGYLDSNINNVDGCYFLYDRGNVATTGPNTGNADKWSCWCASNSTRTKYLMDGSTVSDESFTTVNAPVAVMTLPDTNIYHLKEVITGTTRAEFYVNGVKSCDINTNIPSGAARETGTAVLMVKSAGTTSRQLYTDWTRLAIDLLAARSP